MKYLLLPGYSKENEKWAEELVVNFKKSGMDLEFMKWTHWDGKSNFNMESEVGNFVSSVKEETVILAKSIGTKVFTRALPRVVDNVKSIILMGIPISGFDEVDIEAFQNLKMLDTNRIKVIQNSNDPVGGFDKIKEFIGNIDNDIEVVEVEAITHSYPYVELFTDMIEYFTKL